MTRFALGRKCGAGSAPRVVPAVRARGSSALRASPPRPRLAVERKWRRVRASGLSGGVDFIAVISARDYRLMTAASRLSRALAITVAAASSDGSRSGADGRLPILRYLRALSGSLW